MANSDPAEQHQNKDDEQQKANGTVQAVTEAIAGATSKSTKATQQEDDQNDQ
jgi:hypothetical protein